MNGHLRVVGTGAARPEGVTEEQREGLRLTLEQAERFIGSYVIFPNRHCLTAVTLWAAHTHAAIAFYVTPRLILDSAEPGSGKSRVLELLNLLCRQPEMILSPTTAAIFRMLANDEVPITLLFDETDAIFNTKNTGNYEDLRALLNAGYKRGATIPRCVGDAANMKVQRFKVFAPVALAGLAGGMPRTITSRAVAIHMRKRAKNQKVKPYSERDAEDEAEPIAAWLDVWMVSLIPYLIDARPEMPEGVEDRPAEVWEALLAIADAAGGDWPKKAREACTHFVLDSQGETLSFGERLLKDLRDDVFTVWDNDGKPVRLRVGVATAEILARLVELDDAPWAGLRGGKPLDGMRLAKELRRYEVYPSTFRDESNKAVKGYEIGPAKSRTGEPSVGLSDPWARHLPVQAARTGNSGNTGNNAGQRVTPQIRVTAQEVTAQEAVTGLTCEVTAVTAVTGISGQESEKVARFGDPSVHEGQLRVPGTPPVVPKCEGCDEPPRPTSRFCSLRCAEKVRKRNQRAAEKTTPKETP